MGALVSDFSDEVSSVQLRRLGKSYIFHDGSLRVIDTAGVDWHRSPRKWAGAAGSGS